MVPLPAWVSALPLWRWHSIPGTALASVDPKERPLGNTGSRSKIEAWCGATLKRDGSIYMLGAAGGHADYAGNEVDALQLLSDQPRWEELAPASPNSEVINGSQFYLDNRPAAVHTYYATQFIDSQNRMVVISTPGLNGPFPPPPAGFAFTTDTRSFSFDMASRHWDAPDRIARFPGTGDYFACLCVKHPWTDTVYYSRNGGSGWYSWEPATDQWKRLSLATRGSWYAGVAIDPRRSRMLVVGSYSPIEPEVRALDGTKLAATFTGPQRDVLSTVTGYPGVAYDEAADRYLVTFNDEQGLRLLLVDAATWRVEWAPLLGEPAAARPNGLHNAAQYVPQLRGLVVANSHGGDVQFIRTAL